MNLSLKFSTVALLALTLASTSCIKDEETVFDRSKTTSVKPDHRIDFDLEPTANYVDNIRKTIGATTVSPNVIEFQNDARVAPQIRETVAQKTADMSEGGFDNFNRSTVGSCSNTLFYAVMLSDQNATGNRDICTVFMPDDGSDEGIVFEGPITTGLGITLSVAGADYTTEQLRAMFFPQQRISAGGTFFSSSSNQPEHYMSELGEVEIRYTNTGVDTGMLFVHATGTLDNAPYDLYYKWGVRY